MTSLKKDRSAGSRRRFVLKQSLGTSAGILESLESLDLELTGNIHEEFEKGFDLVNELAATLGRKFAVAEEAMIQMEMEMVPEIEHPESEYDYKDDEDNIKAGGKTGDATDKAKDAPKGNVKAESEELEEDCEEHIDMSDEMVNLRLEAQDAMDKLKTHAISPKEAGDILRDMVQYMGGAMKAYMDLAQGIGKYAYAGVGAPRPDAHMIAKDRMKHNYIGKDELDTEPASPEQYRDRT